MKKTDLRLSELIARCLLGIATEQERGRLQAWLDADPGHEEEYARIAERLRRDLLTADPADARRAWKVFEGRLPGRLRRRLQVRRVWRYAAAVVVLAVLLAGGLWYALPSMDDGRVADIVPGSPKAMLQTGTGEEVEIFPELADVGTQTAGWAVHNDKGVLRYDAPTRADSIRGLYHTLTVPRGGEYTVLLADGTRINVNSESRLRYPVVFAPADTVRRVYVSGEAYFQVARHETLPFEVCTAHGTLPFEVCTAHGTVRVYGTKFNVHDYADEGLTVVTLSEGAVSYVVDGREHRLSPGGQLTYDHATGRVEERQVDAAIYCSWIDGVFEFSGMPLERIMRQLARWYDIDYRFEDKGLEGRLFTGIAFRNAPLQNLLDQIEKTTRIHFEVKNRTIIITN